MEKSEYHKEYKHIQYSSGIETLETDSRSKCSIYFVSDKNNGTKDLMFIC